MLENLKLFQSTSLIKNSISERWGGRRGFDKLGIIKLFDNTPNQPSKFREKIELKQMMTREERVAPAVKLILNLQSQFYVIL